MRVMTVNYLIDEDEYNRLKEITSEYNKQGLNLNSEKIFEIIMVTGAKYDKDDKFKFHEWKLGLREDYK